MITVYYSPSCKYSTELLNFLNEKQLRYEGKDIIESQNKVFRNELIEKSSQCATPVIELDLLFF